MSSETIISVIIGALISIFITIVYERLRKPHLRFEIETPPLDITYNGTEPAKNARFLRVVLWNDPFQLLVRETAMHCQGEIQFYHIEDGVPLFMKNMRLRWAGSEEPFSPQMRPDGTIENIFDITKYNSSFFRDCFSGSKETIDVVARFDDDEECYVWTSDYAIKGWKNKERMIPKGRYLVKIIVFSAGEKISALFQLENSITRKDFRLTPANFQDMKKIKN